MLKKILLTFLFFLFTNNVYATSYTYDSLNRLTRVTYDNSSFIAYVYDPAGNILQVDTYNANPPVALEGDVNGDNVVDLNDAVLALQVLVGLAPAGTIDASADIGNDGNIGIEEVIYALRDVAGF